MSAKRERTPTPPLPDYAIKPSYDAINRLQQGLRDRDQLVQTLRDANTTLDGENQCLMLRLQQLQETIATQNEQIEQLRQTLELNKK